MSVTRNSFSGYTYQQLILTLFVALMDTDGQINEIESESDVDHQFDDLKISGEEEIHVQIKNYPDTTLNDLSVDEDLFIIKGNKNKINRKLKNVVVINTNRIEPNTEILGLKATKLDEIYVIPMTTELIKNKLAELYYDEERMYKLFLVANNYTVDRKFNIHKRDLPTMKMYSTELEDETINIRNVDINIEKGNKFIIGKPGVGKSHFADEIINYYPDSILYRFWIGPQDFFIKERLLYREFIKQISFLVFKNPKRYSEREIINKINQEELLIVIDGLDHVENYMEGELDNYFDFFEKIEDGKVIVLSRPLKKEINYPRINLENWTFKETSYFLDTRFNIKEYEEKYKIYDITDGYPIITQFVASHYVNTGVIELKTRVTELDDYYRYLLSGVPQIKSLSIFLINNSFILEKELETFSGSEYFTDVIYGVIKSYPFLFKIESNRISLVHDSLNTFLRKEIDDTGLIDKGRDLAFKSIMNEEIQFISRFSSFDFDYEKKTSIIKKYANISLFEKLLNHTYDFESIKEFYKSIQNELVTVGNILDYQGYYDLVLIQLIIQRNNAMGSDSFIHQVLKYLVRVENNNMEIYSNGVLWAAYQLEYNSNEYPYRKLAMDNYNSESEIENYKASIEAEDHFFYANDEEIKVEEIEKILEDEAEMEYQKKDILANLFAIVYLQKQKNNRYYSIIEHYMIGDHESSVAGVISICNHLGIRTFFARSVLSQAEFIIFENGGDEDNNPFLTKNLNKIITEQAHNGSWEVEKYVTSYIRLANYQNREIDLENINKFIFMYYVRKDYSVSSLSTALLILEEKGFTEETDSIEIIQQFMNRSEKGIRGLMNSYFSQKDSNIVGRHKELIETDDFQIDILRLPIAHINKINPETIISELINRIKYSLTIPYYEIERVIKSKHEYHVFKVLVYNQVEVFNVPKEKISIFENRNVRVREEREDMAIQYEEDRKPFINGRIDEEDLDYIEDSDLTHLEISKLIDGWYHSLPFVEAFASFPNSVLREDINQILFNAMTTNINELLTYSSYYDLPGNILKLIDGIGLDVEWDELYNSLVQFISISLIQFPLKL